MTMYYYLLEQTRGEEPTRRRHKGCCEGPCSSKMISTGAFSVSQHLLSL